MVKQSLLTVEMAADVGYLVRALNNSKADRSRSPVTRDFLGESFPSSPSEIDHSQELDLDLQVPAGWEKRLDLKSGKVYLQKCSSEPSWSATRIPLQKTKFSTIERPSNTMEETNLDLKLESNSIASTMNSNNLCSYESVCTLDKVKLALDRAKNSEQIRKMFLPRPSKSPSTSSTSTKVTQEMDNEEVEEDERTLSSKSHQRAAVLLTAAGCPNCLMYVMISKENPNCPKCNSTVSLPAMKRPRIDLDLNISIG